MTYGPGGSPYECPVFSSSLCQAFPDESLYLRASGSISRRQGLGYGPKALKDDLIGSSVKSYFVVCVCDSFDEYICHCPGNSLLTYV